MSVRLPKKTQLEVDKQSKHAPIRIQGILSGREESQRNHYPLALFTRAKMIQIEISASEAEIKIFLKLRFKSLRSTARGEVVCYPGCVPLSQCGGWLAGEESDSDRT